MTCNFGLYLAKRFGRDHLDRQTGAWSRDEATRPVRRDGPPRREVELLDRIAASLGPQSEARRLAARDAQRIKRLVAAQAGQCRDFRAKSRTVVGMGEPTALENGLHCAWNSGWPEAPGSGIKGAVRHWVETRATSLAELGVSSEEEFYDCYLMILGWGPEEGDAEVDAPADEGAGGEMVFFDAPFLPDAKVILDVMTPHYSDWRERGAPPADWSDPNPIPFLAVERGATLRVGVAPRRPSARGLAPLAMRWVVSALAESGLGAKTASGFGRFEPIQGG